MASNVFTKNEILKELANRGYFIDSYTLDTFFQKWKIEAIFEDEQGSEFFDKNALDLVLSNLFSQKNEQEVSENDNQVEQVKPLQEENNTPQNEETKEVSKAPEAPIVEDSETVDVLKNISLSDGTPLINKVSDEIVEEVKSNSETVSVEQIKEEPLVIEDVEPIKIEEDKAPKGVLATAMEGMNQEDAQGTQEISKEPVDDRLFEAQSEVLPAYNPQNDFQNDSADFDDISLLSESLEAQERFKNYLVSELSKKNVDLAPKTNEFKLDISERTLSMIARTMAKKIAKHVSMICSQDAKAAAKLEDVQAKNEKLEQRAKELEEQNKKLRLLLAESNKNLNSYKPSMFGLYKKVNPQ